MSTARAVSGLSLIEVLITLGIVVLIAQWGGVFSPARLNTAKQSTQHLQNAFSNALQLALAGATHTYRLISADPSGSVLERLEAAGGDWQGVAHLDTPCKAAYEDHQGQRQSLTSEATWVLSALGWGIRSSSNAAILTPTKLTIQCSGKPDYLLNVNPHTGESTFTVLAS